MSTYQSYDRYGSNDAWGSSFREEEKRKADMEMEIERRVNSSRQRIVDELRRAEDEARALEIESIRLASKLRSAEKEKAMRLDIKVQRQGNEDEERSGRIADAVNKRVEEEAHRLGIHPDDYGYNEQYQAKRVELEVKSRLEEEAKKIALMRQDLATKRRESVRLDGADVDGGTSNAVLP